MEDSKKPTSVQNLTQVPLQLLIEKLKSIIQEASNGVQESSTGIDNKMQPILAELRKRITNWIRKERAHQVVANFFKIHANKHPAIQNCLGLCYEYGFGLDKNNEEAAKLYKLAAEKGDANAQSNLGECYQYKFGGITEDVEKAIALYRLAADQSNANAQFNLGSCYERGINDKKDLKKAVELYRLAADQGHAKAQYNLANCYHEGRGVEKDENKAVELYHLAAENGYDLALDALSIRYKQGVGVTKSFKEAARLRAIYHNILGVNSQYGLRGFPKDEKQAVKYYLDAYLHNADAQYNLAECYIHGIGVEKDVKEAVQFYRLAVWAGDASAQNILGLCYLHGRGNLTKYKKEAVSLFRCASNQGNEEAQNNLGFCYQEGIGVEKDAKEAVRLYRLAAEQGYAPAQTSLAFCYLQGIGLEKDAKEAVRLFHLALANQIDGDDIAEVTYQSLGDCYRLGGNGVQRNLKEAKNCYEHAAKAEPNNQNNDYYLKKIIEENDEAFKDPDLYTIFNHEKIYNVALEKENCSKNILEAADQKQKLVNLTTQQRTEIGKRWPNCREQILKSDEKIASATIKSWANDEKTPASALILLLTNPSTFQHLTAAEWFLSFMHLTSGNKNLVLSQWLREEKNTNNKIALLKKLNTKPVLSNEKENYLIKISEEYPQYAGDILKLTTEKTALPLEVETKATIEEFEKRYYYKIIELDAKTIEKTDSQDNELVLEEKLIQTFINELCDFDKGNSTSTSRWLPWISSPSREENIYQKISNLDWEYTTNSQKCLSQQGKKDFVILLLDLYYQNEILKDKTTTFQQKYEQIKSSYRILHEITDEVDKVINATYNKDKKGIPTDIMPGILSSINSNKQTSAGSVIYARYKNVAIPREMPSFYLQKRLDEKNHSPFPSPSAPVDSSSNSIAYLTNSREKHTNELTETERSLVAQNEAKEAKEAKKQESQNYSTNPFDDENAVQDIQLEGVIYYDQVEGKENKNISSEEDNDITNQTPAIVPSIDLPDFENENKYQQDDRKRSLPEKVLDNSNLFLFWKQHRSEEPGLLPSPSSQTPIPKESKNETIALFYDDYQQISGWMKDGVFEIINKDQLLDALIAEPDLLKRFSDVTRGKILAEARNSLPSTERLELDEIVLDFLKKSRENQARISQQEEGINLTASFSIVDKS